MSALGKPVIEGDFDTNGQVVVQSPQDRVIERSVVVTRTVTQAPVEAPQPAVTPVAQDLFEPASQPPLPYPLAPRPQPADLTLDRSRDDLLTPFGKATLTDRYLMPGESFQDMFARVSCAYADDDASHAQRLYDYMSRLWFMPATPILSNGGTKRGLPISCFLNDVSDSLEGIVGTWNENVCAGQQWRRHRHLLGQGPLHRRKGEDRQDQRASSPSSM
jgi:ribonucleoside-diphosphate reductase alpha chain